MLHREVQGEALTGETDGPAIEPRNQESGMPMLLPDCRPTLARAYLQMASSGCYGEWP